jgi:hypothetical protein
MTNAPKRIYLDGDAEVGDGKFPRCFEDAKYASEPPVEYTRTDLSRDAVEALEAKLAKAVGLLEAWVNVAAHCTIEEGVCCCGDNMDTHSDPMDCGHLPVDHGAYVARGLVKETNATLAELTGGKDDAD